MEGEKSQNFQEADRRYAELKQQYDSGSLSTQEFEAQLEQIMMQDEEGRWWSKHPETGEWHYYDDNTWVQDISPDYEKGIPEVTTKEAPSEPSSVPYPKGTENEEDRHRKVVLPRVLAAGLIGVVAIAGIGLVIWLLGEDDVFPAGATATLPNVVGMSQAEAEEALRAEGFKVTAETQESSLLEDGTVVEQNPSGGQAEERSAVKITVGRGPQPASGYTVLKHVSGTLAVEVPSGWSDTITDKDGTSEGRDVDPGEGIGPAITATTDHAAWADPNRLGAPGVYLLASRELASYTEDELVEEYLPDPSSCTPGTRQGFDRSPYSGKMQESDCGEGGGTRLTLAVAPEDRECAIMMQMVMYSEADREAARHVRNTFEADCQGIS